MQGQVRGVVVDDETGSGIIGALVTVQAMGVRVETGRLGEFELAEVEGRDLVVVGARKGYYNGYAVVTAPAAQVEIRLIPVPAGDNADYEFIDPEKCADCHVEQRR